MVVDCSVRLRDGDSEEQQRPRVQIHGSLGPQPGRQANPNPVLYLQSFDYEDISINHKRPCAYGATLSCMTAGIR